MVGRAGEEPQPGGGDDERGNDHHSSHEPLPTCGIIVAVSFFSGMLAIIFRPGAKICVNLRMKYYAQFCVLIFYQSSSE